jgi:DNA-binding response OmpR family regulator
MTRILVVEDDATVAEVVLSYLERAGFDVQSAADGPAGLAAARRDAPDLVVLDVMLPGLDGIEVCRRMRAASDVPVIMLTALGGEVDRVLGLEVGADDYLTKPFSPRELVLRVRAVLRRAGQGSGPAPDGPADGGRGVVLHDGDLEVDVTAHRATQGGAGLSLTVREFDLLAHLLANPGRAFTREHLMREVWGWEFGDLSTVTVHVRRLRAKIERDPAAPTRLVTVWGVGYRWDGAGRPAPAAAGGPG